MLKIFRFLMFACLVLVAGTIAAFVFLPWWQALIVVLAIIFAIVWSTEYLIRSVWRQMAMSVSREFEKRSMVLRGAAAQVHSVVVAQAPPDEFDDEDDADEQDEEDEDDEGDDADDGPKVYYQVDVTISPAAAGEASKQAWETSALHLVPSEASPPVFDPVESPRSIGEQGYEPLNVQVQRGGRYGPDDDGEHQGARRLRMLFALPADWKEVKFQYYGEQFGHIRLPPATPAPPPPPRLT